MPPGAPVSHDLIDTTEMYLRTILELQEEGIVPLRARIAERLHQSGPTVSQTVARMERDGLVTVEGDRHLEFTALGRQRAISVMRKHRLAELLLVNVIGVEYEEAHIEACRWEHVMSDEVERKVYALLGRPTVSPYGNAIPGLEELDAGAHSAEPEPVITLLDAVGGTNVVVRRISEQLQTHPEVISEIHSAGVEPGALVTVYSDDDGVNVQRGQETISLTPAAASLIFVSVNSAATSMAS
ncbi:MAG: metal-dependent transcriptional regulator [Corynebacteriales bacterium]|nr:metal-dependent transcriptional regulator [Mycobacteriales bacterium]